MTVKNKIKPTRTCMDGKHTFIPARWKVSGTSRKCVLFVCQHCMCTVDQSEQEVMMVEHNARAAKAEKAAEPTG